MSYWKLLVIEFILFTAIVLSFIKNPILGIIIFFIDIVINIGYWSILLSFKHYVDKHNNDLKNSVIANEEKYEELTLEQSIQLYKYGFADRGKDKQPIFVKEIYEKKNKKRNG